jgi:hypothetical protein
LQPQLEQQLSQPHEASSQQQEASSQQHEASSQQQLASQQPQPLWHLNMPQRPSNRQQPRLQPQLEQHESSQPHEASSQQQEASSAQQLASSQQHDFSQQLQLASQQQPQPPPSIRSNKQQVAKLGLARAMLNMSAPRKFHFIEHRLLNRNPAKRSIYRLPATRDAAPRRTNAGRGRRMLGYRAGQLDRRKGHFKVPGVGNRWDLLGGIPWLCVNASRAIPWLEVSGPVS